MENTKSVSITRLIMVPALITLGITILRLLGELQHWHRPWVDSAAGGGGALIGISWLPIIFGPYFAVKLLMDGNAPQSLGKAVGFAFLGLLVAFGAMWLLQATFSHPSILSLAAFVLSLVAAFIPRIGWRSLGNALLAYAFAARIPVLVVMYLAMRGNGGAGWGTHYDVTDPMFANLSFLKKYFDEAVLPQMTMWIAWTTIVGSLFGVAAASIARRLKHPVRATA